jgi:hypothetical protein
MARALSLARHLILSLVDLYALMTKQNRLNIPQSPT